VGLHDPLGKPVSKDAGDITATVCSKPRGLHLFSKANDELTEPSVIIAERSYLPDGTRATPHVDALQEPAELDAIVLMKLYQPIHHLCLTRVILFPQDLAHCTKCFDHDALTSNDSPALRSGLNEEKPPRAAGDQSLQASGCDCCIGRRE